ncbi:MAG: DUF5666 domain-containing protein [Terracidiphilus sp.]
MKLRLAAACALALALTAAASAQDQGSTSGSASPSTQGSGDQGGYGRRGGRGGFGGGMGMMGRGLSGTVTEAAADHYTVKSFSGETYTVHFSANTRIMKQGAGMRGGGQGGGQGSGQRDGEGRGQGSGQGSGGGRGFGGNPPQPIKATDIKVGDAISSMGEIDATAKSVGATAIVLLDPARAKQMQDMEASYGKTWLMGKVTAIDGVKVTLTGSIDNAPYSFVADENTTFRRRRDPITLADIQVGDTVRADGAVKDGVFTAATVGVMGMMNGENPSVPRNQDAPSQPQ